MDQSVLEYISRIHLLTVPWALAVVFDINVLSRHAWGVTASAPLKKLLWSSRSSAAVHSVFDDDGTDVVQDPTQLNTSLAIMQSPTLCTAYAAFVEKSLCYESFKFLVDVTAYAKRMYESASAQHAAFDKIVAEFILQNAAYEVLHILTRASRRHCHYCKFSVKICNDDCNTVSKVNAAFLLLIDCSTLHCLIVAPTQINIAARMRAKVCAYAYQRDHYLLCAIVALRDIAQFLALDEHERKHAPQEPVHEVAKMLDQNLMAKFMTTPQYTVACTEHVNQAGVNSKSISRHSNYNKSTSRAGCLQENATINAHNYTCTHLHRLYELVMSYICTDLIATAARVSALFYSCTYGVKCPCVVLVVFMNTFSQRTKSRFTEEKRYTSITSYTTTSLIAQPPSPSLKCTCTVVAEVAVAAAAASGSGIA
eukprot:3285-Heterococcus_DN1.PRE.1